MHTLSLPSHLYYLIKVFPTASARIVVKCMSMKNTSCKKHRFEIVILEVCDLGNMEVAVSPLSKWRIQLDDQSSETTRGNLSSHTQPRTLRCQKDAEVTGGTESRAFRSGGKVVFPSLMAGRQCGPGLSPAPDLKAITAVRSLDS